MAKNANLNKAKQAQNDEFYTQIEDIEKELRHYKEYLKGKTIFCNCDDPEWSNFWKYFHLNFAHLELKKLISTHFDKSEPTYKLEYTGGNDTDINVGEKTPLSQNGDFKSPECIELLHEADIIITNPPFSIAREEYVPLLFEHNKTFLIIGDIGWITYKDLFPLFKEDKMWNGYNNVTSFMQPDGSIKKFGNKLWFTNLPVKKRNEEIILYKTYSEEEYPKYDNYDAIEVSKVSEIPMDYDDVMGVPVTFMSSYNPNQFEIVGTVSAASDPNTLNLGNNYKEYIGYKQDGTKNGRTGSTFGKCPVLVKDDGVHPYYEKDGIRVQATYPRIFIRRKKS